MNAIETVVMMKNSLQLVCALGLVVRSIGLEEGVEGDWLCVDGEAATKGGQSENEGEEHSKTGKEKRKGE